MTIQSCLLVLFTTRRLVTHLHIVWLVKTGGTRAVGRILVLVAVLVQVLVLKVARVIMEEVG